MNSARLPSPIVFDLDPAESSRIRKRLFRANGGRLFAPIFAVNGLVAIAHAALRVYRHDSLAWVFICFAVVQVALVVALLRGWSNLQALVIKPQLGTRIIFNEAGVEIDRCTRSTQRVKRFVPFAEIRSVQLTPDALILYKRWFPLAIVPKRAVGADGEQLMRFFEDHLVARRSLRRSSSRATYIVNTTSP